METCIFCKIADGSIDADKIYEDEAVIAFRDINPQAPVHILVVPRQHRATVLDYGAEDAGLLGKMILAASKIARSENIAKEGFRIVLNCGKYAGQEVAHLHWHLLGGRRLTWPPG